MFQKIIVVSMLLILGPRLWSAPIFKPGDTVVHMGDSITIGRKYTATIQNYLRSRYSSYNLKFINFAVSGDTVRFSASLCWEPLNDVIRAKPAVVTMCFGMNDGGYGYEGGKQKGCDALDINAFKQGLAGIVKKLQASIPGVKIVILTNGITEAQATSIQCVDWIPKDYASCFLRKTADAAISVAKENGLPYWDIHQEMTAMSSNVKAANPRNQLTMDGIHPDQAGGLPYAYGALKALGVPPRADSVELAVPASIKAAGGAKAGNLVSSPNGKGWRFELSLTEEPYVHLPGAVKGLRYFPAFQRDLNLIRFTAKGLAEGAYMLSVDGLRSGPFARKTLEAGINLADYWPRAAARPGARHAIEVQKAAAGQMSDCVDTVIADFEEWDVESRDWCFALNNWGQVINHYIGKKGGKTTGDHNDMSCIVNEKCPASKGFQMWYLEKTSPGYNGSKHCARQGGYCALPDMPYIIIETSSWYADTKDGVSFMMNAYKGSQYKLKVQLLKQREQCSKQKKTDVSWQNDWEYTFNAAPGWKKYFIRWSDLLPGKPNPENHEQGFPFNKNEIVSVKIGPAADGNYDFAIDDMYFACNSSALIR